MASRNLSVGSSLVARPSAGTGRIPKYGLHKPSGRAVVYLDRRPVYLGRHGSPESWERYWQLVAQFPTPASRKSSIKDQTDSLISVAVLIERYMVWAATYYGPAAEYLCTIRAAAEPLLALYASSSTSSFDAECLDNVRTHRINQGMKPQGRRRKGKKGDTPRKTDEAWKPISRSYINRLTQIIVRIFGWGVTKKLVPATTWYELKAVEGIKKGKNPKLRECRRILPVPVEHVDAVLAIVSPEIATMIQLQMLTAMRPDEVTSMRPCDIDKKGEVWLYTLGDRSHGGMGHKTDHLEDGGDKFVCLGPKAQKVLEPFLASCLPTNFLFSPKTAAERRYPKGNRGLKPKAKYDDDTYCRAVKRGCKRAGVPIWTPNRLRHNRATEVRITFGLEAAQAVLDHRSVDTTQIYAEKQEHLKREVARKIG